MKLKQNEVLIIAEAGVNHNGDISIAKKLIDIASDAGVDFIKFQTFKSENLVSKAAKKASYQQKNLKTKENSQYEMLKKLELSYDDHHNLIDYCKLKKINFLSTGFDLESIDFLNSLKLPVFKIPSGEITNLPYLQKIGSFNKKVIVSTGMCIMSEISNAIKVLEEAGTLKKNITVLHCTTDYPTPFKDVNLNAMLQIKKELKVEIGYSDHTLGIEVPIAAVAMGAKIIEKHFTLDKNLPGPDHKASLEPNELVEMVKSIRNIELALGEFDKKPTKQELKNMLVGRKSIHASKNLKKGSIIKAEDIIMKRPGTGISPMLMNDVIGKKLNKNKEEDKLLSWEDFN
jgi:N,N'-diacetyllegionaminate synthase